MELYHKKKKVFLLSGLAILLVIGMQACSNDPPVGKPRGTETSSGPTYTPTYTPTVTYTPTPCSAVFGNNVAEASNTAVNDIWYSPFAPSGNKSLFNLSIYTASAASVTYELGVYSDNGGTPSTLMTETGPHSIGPATVWSTSPTSQSVSLSGGVTYWLAIHSTTAAYVGSTQTYGYQTAGAFGSLPPTAVATVVPSSYSFSIYGTTCP